MSWLVVRVEQVPTEQGLADVVQFLSHIPTAEDRQRGLVTQGDYIQGKRGWCDSLEDRRIEEFRTAPEAREASELYGGEIVSQVGALRMDLGADGWKRLEPSGVGLA